MLVIMMWSLYLIMAVKVTLSESLQWDSIYCSSDTDQTVPEGITPDIGRFPWLGVVQHSFYLGGEIRYAITGGVLIHPAYAIAPAEDIAKIQQESLINNTKFIVWQSKTLKYSLDVKDYVLHPEYVDKVTFATIALLELFTWGETGVSDLPSPVLPICMPVKGAGLFSDLYAVKMTDVNGELEKEAMKMNYVIDKDCEEFYYRAQLTYTKMSPTHKLCATSQRHSKSCVWDGGAALIARQSFGYWLLLGFGVRGPGCGAPARFINIHNFLPWIDETISKIPFQDEEDVAFILRQLSPVTIQMYKADVKIPKETGQCGRKDRGHVLYKDSAEIVVNKNFAQGFFFVSVAQVAQFTCVIVHMETTSKSNAGVWIEHYCHRDQTGISKGRDIRKLECFVYFKSAAYVEFRFFFSFKANIDMTLYGTVEDPKFIPNPFQTTETTNAWWPTAQIIQWGSYVPYYKWWYWL